MTTPVRNEEIQAAIRSAMAALEVEIVSMSPAERLERLQEAETDGLRLIVRGTEIRIFLRITQSATSDELEYA